ncbi:hypothetical protein K0M31_002065 [Melipona bicolor]|uniref:Uncharacterized protein n=1 Tax=Melipona bicolor TaxID=60889 RepID=A0AA40GGR0_9HYME|nr:hypothetical protein K0M31_002065 [Melipona bicolor]
MIHHRPNHLTHKHGTTSTGLHAEASRTGTLGMVEETARGRRIECHVHGMVRGIRSRRP